MSCGSVNGCLSENEDKEKGEEKKEGSNHVDVIVNVTNRRLHIICAPSFPRAREYAVRIIAGEHLSYKIAVDTCQGNIKL